MADLMSDRTVTFQSLKNKYGDFMVPAVKIRANGKDLISELHLAVENVSIVQSLNSAGSCSFSVVNAYDQGKREFDSGIKRKLQLGTILTVDIGYGSALSTAFKGYVSSVSYSFQDSPAMDITAMDVRRLMMNTTSSFRMLGGKTSSDFFREVMEPYKKLSTNLQIDRTTDTAEEQTMTQNTSDYQFVQSVLAVRGGREFFVLGDKVYFRKPEKVKAPVTTLTWGSSLLSFRREASYLYNEIQVLGKDEAGNRDVLAKATVKASDAQTIVVAKPEPVIVGDPFVTDKEKAEARLKEELRRRQKASQRGSGSSIGIPEIVPGRFIRLEKLDSSLDKKYYIVRARHTLGSGGYTTDFDLEGWE